jgi:hypothetical protein
LPNSLPKLLTKNEHKETLTPELQRLTYMALFTHVIFLTNTSEIARFMR